MTIEPTLQVADIAARHPGTIRIFQRHGIDFCCGGKRPLDEVCEARGLDSEQLRAELEEALAAPSDDERSWTEASLSELIEHIVARYHGRLRQDLPALTQMAEKVRRVHGETYPEMIPPLAATFEGLRAELESHMAKEEQILFPAIQNLEAGSRSGSGAGGPMVGSLDGPIAAMEHEHDDAAAALGRMRELTGGYQPPEGACNTFRGLFAGLAELETDLHRHIHLENNVLFPRAARLEEELSGSVA